MRRGVIGRIAAVVGAGLEGCASAAADRTRHEHPIAPDDRDSSVRAPERLCATGCSRPLSTFQLSGNCCSSATPAACGPRNDGQLPESDQRPEGRRHSRIEHRSRHGSRRMRDSVLREVPSASCRGTSGIAYTASPITERRSCLPFTSNRYRPAVPQPSSGTGAWPFNSSATGHASWPASSMPPDSVPPRP